MAAIKTITRRINYLQNITADYGSNREMKQALATVQLLMVQDLANQLKVQVELHSSDELTPTEMDYIKQKDKFKLIKSFRERLGLGLGDAKHKAEELCVRLGVAKWEDYGGYKSMKWND